MTGQINDKLTYRQQEYMISAIEKPRMFFNIKKLGIDPEPLHTACWRGYIAGFSIVDSSLALCSLETNNSNGKATPVPINGKLPDVITPEGLVSDYLEWRQWHYSGINLMMKYTGGLVITRDLIRDRYVHMGFQSSLSYTEAIELRFKKGVLVEENDLSEYIAELRETQQRKTHEQQLMRLPFWIAECFDLSYMAKLPRDTS